MSSTSPKRRSSSPKKRSTSPKRVISKKKRFTLSAVPQRKSKKTPFTLSAVPQRKSKKTPFTLDAPPPGKKPSRRRVVVRKVSKKKRRPRMKLSISAPMPSSMPSSMPSLPSPTLKKYTGPRIRGDTSLCSKRYNRNIYGPEDIEAGASSDAVYISCPPKVTGEQCLDGDTKYVVKTISSYSIEKDGGSKREIFPLSSDKGKHYFNREVKNQQKAAKYNISPQIVDHWICEVDHKHLGFIVMEHIKGTPLVDILEMSDEELADIHILINKLHRQAKLIHNDLHLGNIIKQDDGQFKIIDFGLSYDNVGSDSDRKMNEDNDRFTLNNLLFGDSAIPTSSEKKFK